MFINRLKNSVALNTKNLIGWRTDRKIVVISVDDYGNVRVNSKASREKMDSAGLKISNRFDRFDALETRTDLEILFETLTSFRDSRGRHPVFSAFVVPCNINFEKVIDSGFERYIYELLPETFEKLSYLQPDAFKGSWNLWKEGMNDGLIVPLFHGREHVNIKAFEEKLRNRDHDLITAIRNRSYTSVTYKAHKTISTMAAFDFWEFDENRDFEAIIEDGLNAFESVFGFRTNHFNPPGGREHSFIHTYLAKNGIDYIDTPLIKKEHQGRGKFKTVLNYSGKTNDSGQTFLVRNVVFEPIQDRDEDWVKFSLKQIEAAFRWNRPAVISSHRVNFCGHIDEENRKKGIQSLKKLLKEIVRRWPEVEFMAASKLGELIQNDIKKRQ